MVIYDFFRLQSDFTELFIFNLDWHWYKRKTDHALLINVV